MYDRGYKPARWEAGQQQQQSQNPGGDDLQEGGQMLQQSMRYSTMTVKESG